MSVMRIAPGSAHQGSLRADLVTFEFGERAASSGIRLGADTALSIAPFPGGSDPPAVQPRAVKPYFFREWRVNRKIETAKIRQRKWWDYKKFGMVMRRRALTEFARAGHRV